MLAKLIFVFALLAVALAAPQYYYPGSGYGYSSGYSSGYPGYYGYSGYSPLSYSGYGSYVGSGLNYGYGYY